MFKKKRAIRAASSVTSSSLYRLIKSLPEWRIRHRLQQALDRAVYWSFALMRAGFLGLVLAHPFKNQIASFIALSIYGAGLLVYPAGSECPLLAQTS